MATNTTPAKPGIIYPNDYSLVNLTLLTAITTMDMKLMMTELAYNEDLFNNTASGYLLIVDSMGYIETLHMMGNEYLRLTFGKTGDTVNQVDKLFRVYKIDKRKPEGNQNTESYCLYFCSDEMLLSEQYKVSKSYKNGAIVDDIKDVLTTYLKVPVTKLSIFEQTYGTYDLIIPNIKPFDAINFLASYARPVADNTGADMIFFEDKTGFNFRSIQTLIQQSPYVNYSYEPKNYTQDTNKKVFTVLTYEIMDSFDTLQGLNSGVFANRLLSIDPLLRRYMTTDFNYATYAAQEASLNKYPVINNMKNRRDDMLTDSAEAFYRMTFTNYNQYESPLIKANPDAAGRDVFAATFMTHRTAQLNLVNYTRVKISVPGDPGLTVGKVVNFSLLSKNPTNKSADSFYSGNYLITALKHLFTTTEYKSVVELAKDSTVNQYSNVDSSNPLWNNTVKGIMK